MSLTVTRAANLWTRLGTRWLPFADAASDEMSLGRLLRLALFQIPVGMAMVMMTGTVNRVMIVEFGVHAWLVAAMIAIPILFAPLRTLIGHRSDTHRSVLGWRRIPYLWIGLLARPPRSRARAARRLHSCSLASASITARRLVSHS
jgi:BCD family chlorophyll transporter-like MFS transporter